MKYSALTYALFLIFLIALIGFFSSLYFSELEKKLLWSLVFIAFGILFISVLYEVFKGF